VLFTKQHSIVMQKVLRLIKYESEMATHSLTPWSRTLEELTGSQLVKKFPAFYRTRKFIAAFISARQLSLS